MKVGLRQVRALKLSAVDLSALQIGFRQVRILEVSELQVRLPEHGTLVLSLRRVGVEADTPQVGVV